MTRSRRSCAEIDAQIVSNPKFLRGGAAIGDFKRRDRIAIGTTDDRTRRVMRGIYRRDEVEEADFPYTAVGRDQKMRINYLLKLVDT